MKIIIEDGPYCFQIDWAKYPQQEDNLPPIDECIESFFRLLENIYSAESISDCLADGLNAMEYSQKGLTAIKTLRNQ